MPYEPTTWKTGDVVTSTKLNKMEQGIADAGGGSGGGGVLIVNVLYDPDQPEYQPHYYLDKTYSEIEQAVKSGVVLFEVHDYGAYSSEYRTLNYINQSTVDGSCLLVMSASDGYAEFAALGPDKRLWERTTA